jgi:methionine-rich copper-binding protein CopC
MTTEELSKTIYDTMRAKAILANQNSLAHNDVLSKTPAYKQKIKQLGTPYIKELIKLEAQEFDVVQRAEVTLEDFKGKDVIDQAFERSNKIINLLARAVFVDYDDVEEVIIALAKDKSSILGVAKKINKNKKV